MFRISLLSLATCLALCFPLGTHAQEDDVKAVLRKSIEAHGDKLLLKYRASTSKFKGTMELMGMKLNIHGESSFQKPDKMKNSLTLEIKDKAVQIVQVFNGKTFWLSSQGQTKEIKDEKVLKEVRESLEVEGSSNFVELLDKPYKLSPIGEVKVKGRDAIGIRVSKQGQRDISLFLDKKTYLLVKNEMRSYDPTTGQEVNQEKFFSDYKEQSGIQIPRHVVVHKDGKLFMDLELTETRPLEKLDDAVFAMP